MANTSQASRRAQLRREQEAEAAAKKTKRLITAGVILLAALALVVVGIVVWQSVAKKPSVGAQQTPPNATAEHGILVGGKAPVDGVPHIVIWEDYQCGGCAQMEQMYGAPIKQLVDEGIITAEHRQATFRDGQLGNDASHRAGIAAAAADAVGKFSEYHAAIYANFTTTGYSDALLREDLAALAGITGDDLTRFQELYDTRAFDTFASDAQAAFLAADLGGTPVYKVGDTELVFFDQDAKKMLIEPTPESLSAAITEAFGQ